MDNSEDFDNSSNNLNPSVDGKFFILWLWNKINYSILDLYDVYEDLTIDIIKMIVMQFLFVIIYVMDFRRPRIIH